MIDIYGKGQVCKPKGQKFGTKSKRSDKHRKEDTDCLSLEPDLQDIMAKSRDYDELLSVWKGWRDAVGPEIGQLYPEWVALKNHAAQNGGKFPS